MAGAYCRYCGRRCFVYRQVIVAGATVWDGHMATCGDGADHDRRAVGVDHSRAHNPVWSGRYCTAPCCTPATIEQETAP